ncbi:MAG: hypothetical protein PHI85_11375 [Victivallaceae bacterium]|nr:hypothetical protein [Victivallaceae bacterium]
MRFFIPAVSAICVLIGFCVIAAFTINDADDHGTVSLKREPDHGAVTGNAENNSAAAALYAPPGRQTGTAWKNPQVIPASGKALDPGRGRTAIITAALFLRHLRMRHRAGVFTPTAGQYTGCTSPVRAGPRRTMIHGNGISAAPAQLTA